MNLPLLKSNIGSYRAWSYKNGFVAQGLSIIKDWSCLGNEKFLMSKLASA